MKTVEIDKQIFTVNDFVDGKVKILLNNIDDILFFYDWFNLTRNNSKEYYSKEIYYKSTCEDIILHGTFPILSKNEDFVIIFYDYLTNIKRLN